LNSGVREAHAQKNEFTLYKAADCLVEKPAFSALRVI